MVAREVLDWQTFGQASRELAQRIVDDGYEPDVILSIARGGLFLAGTLGYDLSVKSCFVLNVEYYTGIGETLDAPVVLPPKLDLEEARGMRVLIADDVADTGHTLALVKRLCEAKVAEARVAVLYEKPSSEIACEYVWRRTDRWVDFPWSSQPPLRQPTPDRVEVSAPA